LPQRHTRKFAGSHPSAPDLWQAEIKRLQKQEKEALLQNVAHFEISGDPPELINESLLAYWSELWGEFSDLLSQWSDMRDKAETIVGKYYG
jgi:hypothetical protein